MVPVVPKRPAVFPTLGSFFQHNLCQTVGCLPSGHFSTLNLFLAAITLILIRGVLVGPRQSALPLATLCSSLLYAWGLQCPQWLMSPSVCVRWVSVLATSLGIPWCHGQSLPDTGCLMYAGATEWRLHLGDRCFFPDSR